MWKHDIIDYLQSEIESRKEQEFLTLIKEMVERSHVFYFGNATAIQPILKQRGGEEIDIYKQTPYDIVLYELSLANSCLEQDGYTCDNEYVGTSDKMASMVTHGIDGTQTEYLFRSLKPLTKEKELWNIAPIAIVTQKSDTRYRAYFWDKEYYSNGDEDFLRTCNKEMLSDFAVFSVLNEVLNCQNVVTKDVTPPERLNRKRIRNGKLPLYSYKILEVVKGKPKTKDAGSVPWDYKSPEAVRFHLCRGHFKTYTEDSKLFGKYTGTFWWNPQSRGDRSRGAVEKEYSVKIDEGLAV